MEAEGVFLAPFTVENADYLFDRIYVDALDRGDDGTAHRVARAYVEDVDRAFDFAERLALETFDRPIPHILLLHANRIAADHLPALLDRLERRGYRFASLDDVALDPVYATPDTWRGPWGISWLHRRRASLGLPNRLRDAPDPAREWLEAYREIGTASGD